MRKNPLKHGDSVAAKLRNNDLKLLSPFNDKSPKGEALGYLTAMLYLAPHTLAGGKSVCPHSTEACREHCLFHAGRGKTPRVFNARVRRTRLYLDHPGQFMQQLETELGVMQDAADKHGMKLAIRLNGTSDILWERERVGIGSSIFYAFPRATFYDYTRTPLHHRKVPRNWRLLFSLADDPVDVAIKHLREQHSVAVVIPQAEKPPFADHPEEGFLLDFGWGFPIHLIDGDEHDLRFLDPTPSLVLLKPKGRLARGGAMLRTGFIEQLKEAAR